MAATMNATYSFSSVPKPVSGRKKYREPVEVEKTLYRDLKETSIMWDRRVHRGNTYSIHAQNASANHQAQASTEEAAHSPPHRRPRQKEASPFDIPLPEVERIPVDLTPHLVAKEVVVETTVVEAQTDEFLPEPPPEQYQPQKTGVDVSTQVEDGELFNFDFEAEPILDVLINKTLEQSIMEVEEEYEMQRMKEFKDTWYQWQEQMMDDWNKQVSEEWVRWEQKEAILRQKREEKQLEARALLKVQAVAVANRLLRDLVPNAMRELQEEVFPDPTALAIHRTFLPQLFGQVTKEVQGIRNMREQADHVAVQSYQQAVAKQGAALEARGERLRELERRRWEENQIRRGKIRLLMDGGDGGKVTIGPIQISTKDTVAEIEDRVYAWLQANYAHLVSECPFGVSVCLNGEPVQASSQIFEAKPGQISMVARESPPVEEPVAPADDAGGEDGGDEEE